MSMIPTARQLNQAFNTFNKFMKTVGGTKGGRVTSRAVSTTKSRSRTRVMTKKKKKKSATRPFSKAQYKKIRNMIRQPVMDPIKWKLIQSVQWLSTQNLCEYHSIALGDRTQLQEILQQKFQTLVKSGLIWDPTVVDFTSTQSGNSIPNVKFRVKNSYMKIRFKNNTNFGAKMHLWTAKPKKGTNEGPKGKYQIGLANEFGESAAAIPAQYRELTYWPKHSTEFNRYYSLYNHVFVDMLPGEEYVYFVRVKPYTYNNDLENNMDVQWLYRPHRTRFLFARTEGVISHDAATDTNIGIGESQIDVVYEQHYTFYRNDIQHVTEYSNDNTLEPMDTEQQYQTRDPAKEEGID